MNIGEPFIKLLQSLYTDNTTQVMTPHGCTDDIPITRGLRQGCPASPLLFILLLEPVLQAIENDPECKGWMLSETKRIKALAYADDVALVASSRASLQRALNHFSEFCNYHGMEVGVDPADTQVKLKTVYTRLNSKDAPDTTVTIRKRDNTLVNVPRIEANQHYRYLGVWISLTLQWEKQIEDMQNKVTRYMSFLSNRCFTTAQTALAVNKILVPRITYAMTVVDIPENTLAKWDRQISAIIHRSSA
jgi:hypothetical protein